MPDGDKLCLFITLKSTTCKAAKESCWVSTPNTDSRQHQPPQHTMANSIAASKRCFAASIYILQKDTAAVSAVSRSYDQLFPSPADKCLKSTRQVADKTYGRVHKLPSQ